MKKILFGLLVFPLLSSCLQHREKGKLVTEEDFLALGELKANDGKRFAIVGYPYIDGDIKLTGGFSNSSFPLIGFYNKPEGKGIMIGSFPISHGKGNNQFFAPDNFTNASVLFYDNDGNPIKSSEKMQISFTMELKTHRERVKIHNRYLFFGGPEDIRIDPAE